MVWGCMSTAGTGELQFTAAGQYSIIIMTTALLKKLRVKVMDWPSMSPDVNPIDHLWGILKRKVVEHKVSNIHQLRDVIIIYIYIYIYYYYSFFFM